MNWSRWTSPDRVDVSALEQIDGWSEADIAGADPEVSAEVRLRPVSDFTRAIRHPRRRGHAALVETGPDEPVEGAQIAGQLVSDPAHRHHASGALLMRKFLSGPQDITVAEGTTSVRRMFEKLGGVALQSPSVNWSRLFRPARALGDELVARSGRTRLKAPARPIFAAMDAAAPRIFTRLRSKEPSSQGEPLTPEALIEHLPSILQGTRVIPDYSEAFLRWLFDEMAFVRTRGTLVRCLVRDQDRALGWYVIYSKPGGVGQVMQIAAADADMAAVIDHLFHHAWRSGTAALEGRLEAALYEPLAGRGCLLRYGSRVQAHSREPELLKLVTLGQAFLTRMDGEWWMGHHREPFI
jgi:hypothetical protein